MPRAISRPTLPLETGQAKLWILLVGVNHYQDSHLPSLQYPALDCQGLADALTEATQEFPQREICIHHDFGVNVPQLASVRQTLQQMVTDAQPQDTVLVYFSGHGVLDDRTQQAVLCLADTQKDRLLETGFAVAELLNLLGQCAARQQVIWLDACHSGGMTLRSARGQSILSNPTAQMMNVLGQRAAQSQGFYALLSCDRAQQSWEFPELGHGVFTYFLMRGLRGEAADAQGTIEADGLYKYVYHQTLQYIDKTNQQLRLINQQKRSRGDTRLQTEYPMQTPKRIVEGIGELILGVRSSAISPQNPRQALVIEGLPSQHTLSLSKVLHNAGGFDLDYYPQTGKDWSVVREAIQTCLSHTRPNLSTTALLYIRGRIEETTEGDSWLILGGTRIARSWLRQELRRSQMTQQIVVLDCPGATSLMEWVEELQLGNDQGQCLIAAASPTTESEKFAQILLETLKVGDRPVGLPAAGWIAQLQMALAGELPLHVWLSGAQGVIEVLPGHVGSRSSETAGFDLGLCPYMGLRAFAEEDSKYFYGREGLTRKLIQEVGHQSCLAVVGASGSGKSSIVQAGLIAQLRQGKQVPGSEQWWIGQMRPGDRPLESLARRLVDPGSEKEKTLQHQQIEGILHQGAEGFVYWLRSRPEPVVVLVIDQFEELFTLAATDDRQQFLDLILGAVNYASDRFKLILTLRADFISPCLEIPELALILQRSSVLVPPYLTENDYREVILRPAEQVGLQVEPGLVEVLLQELDHSAGDLPLLEFVLEQLWQQRRSGSLTLQAYQQQIGGLRGALERKAQAVYDDLEADAQACARWIFLSLTQLGEGTEDTRRRVFKADLVVKKYPAELVDRTLQALITAKLIVVGLDELDAHSKGTEPPQNPDLALDSFTDVSIEVAHEILIRHWSTLRWWLEENRNRLRSQRQIEQAALHWKQSDRQSDFLLRGIRLAQAEELYVKYTDELPADTQRFIEACFKERQREQNEIKRRLRRAQITAIVIGTLGLAACGLAGFAYWQQRSAQLRTIEALAASSDALLSSNHQLEALIAGVKAGRQIKQIDQVWNPIAIDSRIEAIATLQQALDQTQELNRLETHSQKVNDVNISADGKLIATASDDKTVKLWRNNGTWIGDIKDQERINTVSFSPTNKIATAGADKTIKLWNQNGKLLKTFSGHQDWTTDVQFSPTDRLLASASRDGTIKLWRLDRNTPIQTLQGHKGWINSIRFSPNGKILVSAGEDGAVKFWQIDNKNNRLLKSFVGHRDRITAITFSPDSKLIATASADKTAKLWSLTGQLLQTFEGHRDQINDVRFHPQGKVLATAGADGIVNFWSLDGALLHTINAAQAEITRIRFSPDGTILMSASADKTARLWRVPDLKPLNSGVSITSLSPDGQTIAAANNKIIQLWKRNNGTVQPLAIVLKGHTSTITAVEFSSSGKLLASASADKTIKLWNIADGSQIRTLTGHRDRVTTLSFRNDGKLLASGSADKTIKLWNVADGSLSSTLKGHNDEITAVRFSPNGRLLASGGYDNTLRLWYRNSPASIVIGRHQLAIAAIAFSPNGRSIASGSWDNTIKLWVLGKDNNEAILSQTLTGHSDGVTSLSFSSDSQILASGSADTTLKLWDAKTGSLLKTLSGHQDRIQSVNFSTDGKTLVSSSDRQGVVLSNLDLDDLLKQGCDRLQSYLQSHPTSDRDLCN
ncbi:MAG: caspase family protein [Phormidesmis sp. CAN_BIN36]|nr:caspase family protein [Phormidesmis sp. CAN_BIN36]